MTVLLLAGLAIAVTFEVVRAVYRLIKQVVELLVKLVAGAFTVMFVVLVLTAFAAHGRL